MSEIRIFYILEDLLFNGHIVELNYSSFFQTSELHPLNFTVSSVPDELIKYLDSYELNYDISDNPYSEPVNIYSNKDINSCSGFDSR